MNFLNKKLPGGDFAEEVIFWIAAIVCGCLVVSVFIFDRAYPDLLIVYGPLTLFLFVTSLLLAFQSRRKRISKKFNKRIHSEEAKEISKKSAIVQLLVGLSIGLFLILLIYLI